MEAAAVADDDGGDECWMDAAWTLLRALETRSFCAPQTRIDHPAEFAASEPSRYLAGS